MKISGNLVDIHKRELYPAEITVTGGKIERIERTSFATGVYILPGLIDSHIHIESSMVTPGAFAVEAVKHGTVGVVSDPHEIANVLGEKGVIYMISDSERVPLKFWFGAPSCVPATNFETSGATLDSDGVKRILKRPEIKYLSEMMNFPGVIYDDSEVIKKLTTARMLGKPVDGHAPGLTGEALRKYVTAGISTDHECSTLSEAMEKISLGMKVLIREGSAARNLDALKELYNLSPENIMLCCDDLHPEMLMVRHLEKLIGKLIAEGYNLYDVIRSATINPVEHYSLEPGLLRPGDSADFIVVDDLKKMNVLETWISGERVFGKDSSGFLYNPGEAVNQFNCTAINLDQIRIHRAGDYIKVIEATEGELTTKQIIHPSGKDKFVESNPNEDILKIVVKDRYRDGAPATGFIKGFGLKKGAFASSIAHDSHNIICIGTNDEDIVGAINEVVRLKGGLSVCSGIKVNSIQLNIGGIMTTHSCAEVAQEYQQLNDLVGSLGCPMLSPFMTLSFMALLVIPELKIGDKGLFDVKKFELVSLFVD